MSQDSKELAAHVPQYAGLKADCNFAVEIRLCRLVMAAVFQVSVANWSYAFDLSSYVLCWMFWVLLHDLEWHYVNEITQWGNYLDCQELLNKISLSIGKKLMQIKCTEFWSQKTL